MPRIEILFNQFYGQIGPLRLDLRSDGIQYGATVTVLCDSQEFPEQEANTRQKDQLRRFWELPNKLTSQRMTLDVSFK